MPTNGLAFRYTGRCITPIAPPGFFAFIAARHRRVAARQHSVTGSPHRNTFGGNIAAFFEANLLKYIRADGAAHTEYLCPAFVRSLADLAFINNILPVFADELEATEARGAGSTRIPSVVVRTERGDRLPLDLVLEIRSKLEAIINVEWESRDVLLIDNGRAMHGRRRLTEGQREIYVQLIA